MIIIDINERQTGKTTRMVRYAANHINEYDNIWIVAYKHLQSKYIKQLLIEMVGDVALLKDRRKIYTTYANRLQESLCSYSSQNSLFLFDEFEWSNFSTFEVDHGFPLMKNAYYCTTKNDGRNIEKLSEQIKKCNFY